MMKYIDGLTGRMMITSAPMPFDEWLAQILNILPSATVKEDDNDELVIYTHMWKDNADIVREVAE